MTQGVFNLFAFLSTLSLRRATVSLMLYDTSSLIFLSTLSLRRATTQFSQKGQASNISIHALLAESDCSKKLQKHKHTNISIHALLAESDRSYNRSSLRRKRYFYPRSPCGERLIKIRFLFRPPKNFYPRSPCGERLCVGFSSGAKAEFLSTLSLRRATVGSSQGADIGHISIHALLAESDCLLRILT